MAFYGGRAFYGLGNDIYISQVILDDLGAAERCYQEADPTAEDSVGLIPSDGGVVTVPNMGNIIRFFNLEGALLIFADNGIWAIYSPQGEGFSITSFAVDFVASVGATGYFNIVDVEGFPFFWSKQGIYRMAPRQDGSVAFQVQEISANKVRNYYANISPLARQYAKGAYDSTNKVIIWLWKSDVDATTDRFLFDRLLNYSLVFDAFYPYSVAIHEAGDVSDKTLGISGIVEANSFATITNEINVCVNGVDDATIEFYYPLSTATQYMDVGPNSLPDATPNGTGTVTVDGTMPLGGGYQTTETSNVGVNHLDLPTEAYLSEGTSDWTFEFRVSSSDWLAPAFTERQLLRLQQTAAGGPAIIHMRTFASGVIEASIDADTGATTVITSGTLITTDVDVFYFSFTRNGNTLYWHVDGAEIGTKDVTGLSFTFSGGATAPRFEFFPNNEDQNFPGTVGEIKWSNTAKYGAGSYTVPNPAVLGSGLIDVDSIADGLVVINQQTVTESAIGIKYIVLQHSQQTAEEAEMGFGSFSDATNLQDWDSSGFSDDYTSYIETSYYLVDNAMTYLQAPWIYTYIKRTSTTFPVAEGNGTIGAGEFGAPWTGS